MSQHRGGYDGPGAGGIGGNSPDASNGGGGNFSGGSGGSNGCVISGIVMLLTFGAVGTAAAAGIKAGVTYIVESNVITTVGTFIDQAFQAAGTALF